MGMPAMPGPGAPATMLRAGPIPGIAIPMFCGMPAVSVAYPAPASHTPAGRPAGLSAVCLHGSGSKVQSPAALSHPPLSGTQG